jgi:inorganic pyrophosphatase
LGSHLQEPKCGTPAKSRTYLGFTAEFTQGERKVQEDMPTSTACSVRVKEHPSARLAVSSGALNAIVETPKGRRNKIEINPETGLLRFSRYVYSADPFPGDYGFIPGTMAQDGDAVDMLLLVNEPGYPGTLIEARPLGMLRMRDHEQDDHKILAVPSRDSLMAQFTSLEDVSRMTKEQIERFFRTYKAGVQILGWGGADEAFEHVRQSVTI